MNWTPNTCKSPLGRSWRKLEEEKDVWTASIVPQPLQVSQIAVRLTKQCHVDHLKAVSHLHTKKIMVLNVKCKPCYVKLCTEKTDSPERLSVHEKCNCDPRR